RRQPGVAYATYARSATDAWPESIATRPANGTYAVWRRTPAITRWTTVAGRLVMTTRSMAVHRMVEARSMAVHNMVAGDVIRMARMATMVADVSLCGR